jgi:hypothetical protein
VVVRVVVDSEQEAAGPVILVHIHQLKVTQVAMVLEIMFHLIMVQAVVAVQEQWVLLELQPLVELVEMV